MKKYNSEKKYNISEKKYNISEVFKNVFIPEDVSNTYIYKYLTILDVIKFRLLNKEYKKDDEIIVSSVKKLQRSFRYHRIDKNYGNMNNCFPFLSWKNYYKCMKLIKKNLLYRKIIVHGDSRFLKNYPLMLVKKSMDSSSSRYSIVNEWLTKNYPIDNTRDILNFFKENRITVREIIFTGW